MTPVDEFPLYRRLRASAGERSWKALLAGETLTPLVSHSDDYRVAETGGLAVTDFQLEGLRARLVSAVEGIDATQDSRNFDQNLAVAMAEHLNISRSEAGRGDVWDYLTFVVVPDIVVQRFSPERASRDRFNGDSRRHVLRRLWRRTLVFHREHYAGDRSLTEDDFVQLLERQVSSVRPALANAVARKVTESGLTGGDRREFTRRIMKLVTYRSGIYWLPDDDDVLEDFVAACAGEVQRTLIRANGEA